MLGMRLDRIPDPCFGSTPQVLHRVLDFLEHRYGITHATVQVERGNEYH